jgi:SEC-C motif
MLFLPQSVYDARRHLWRDSEAGKIDPKQLFQKLLKLDPDDHIGMIGLAKLRREAGDLAGAEEYFWRALETHPCMSLPYLELGDMLEPRTEPAALSRGLIELGVLKQALNDESVLEGLNLEGSGLEGEALEEFKKLPAIEQARLIVGASSVTRDAEPAEVANCLRPFRLIQQMQNDPCLDAETVDAIVAEGERIVPLLVGVLRDWAQDLLADDGDALLKSALALLGETGFPPQIPYLLEFVDLENMNAAGPASWALGRIIERHAEDAAQLIGSMAAGWGPAERIVLTEQILSRPGLDPTGKLLEHLSENLDSWKSEQRDMFFPWLLGAMTTGLGRKGVELGREALLKQSGLLSRSAQRECEAFLAAFRDEDSSPASLDPSPITVYEICSGNAIWDEDEEEDEEGDDEDEFLPAPEPVRSKALPGRNDPCWCNSGKKYKTCHLESDEQEGGPLGAGSPVLPGSNEFADLRNSIGDFLAESVPEREIKHALGEFLGDQPPDKKDVAIMTMDWLLHDWVAPSLGHTVMHEFLVRRGPSRTQREREIVEAWSKSYVGLYEVQELKAGIGLELKDLIFGETFFVHDVSLSKGLARWDQLFVRVVPGERGTEMAGVGITVARQSIEALRLWLEEDRNEAGLEWREYLKKNWLRIRRRSSEVAANWKDSVRLT